jgi:glycosyltransferase involved in cell wall biosynthesis
MVRQLERAGVTHIALPLDSKNPLVMRRNIERLVQVIEAHGVDIVHARSRAPAWSAEAAARRAGCHFVTTFHSAYGRSNFLKRWYNGVMTRGERVIANSDFIANHLRTFYRVDESMLRVIHRGIDLDQFDANKVSAERVIKLATDWRLPDGEPVIMLPGRPTRLKGHTLLIEAMAELGRDDVLCLLVGGTEGRDRYRRELEDLARARGLEGVVRIVGSCNDMAAAYMLADVVVTPSLRPEAFGRVAAEAQAMGRPVVAADHGGAREVVVEGQTGWLARPGDAKALARALAKALDLDAESREQLAARARAHIAANFTVGQMCRQTLETYAEVLGAP